SKPRYVEMTPWLIVLGMVSFLLEIFERRTGWVSRLFSAGAAATRTAAIEETGSALVQPVFVAKKFFRWPIRKSRAALPVRGEVKTVKPSPPSEKVAEPPVPTESDAGLDSLRKARERADRRTGRNS